MPLGPMWSLPLATPVKGLQASLGGAGHGERKGWYAGFCVCRTVYLSMGVSLQPKSRF